MSLEKDVYINNFLAKTEQAETNWETYVRIPFCKAYDEAYRLYKDKLDEQAKSDATKAELLFFALTLVGGTAFTAMFGAAAIKAAARNIALATVIKSRNTALIRAARMIKDSPEASFALGETVDAVSKVVSGKVKTKIAEQFPAERTLGSSFSPEQLSYSTLHALKAARGKILEVAEDLRENSRMSLNETRRVLGEIKAAPFMNPPDKKFYDGRLQDAIELIMYLTLVTTRDKLVKTASTPSQFAAVTSNLSTSDISTVPGSTGYPARMVMRRHYMTTFTDSVVVQDIGSKIDTRINELYRKFFNRNLLGKQLSLEEIRQAHISLVQMNQKYQLPGMLAAR